MKSIDNYTHFSVNDQDACIVRDRPVFYVDAIATDPNDTSRVASATICVCYTREMANLIRTALLVARFGAEQAKRIEGGVDLSAAPIAGPSQAR